MMTDRERRAAIAKTTLDACSAGRYHAKTAQYIDIRDAIDRSVAGSVVHGLETIEIFSERHNATKLSVSNETTLSAIIRLCSADSQFGVLNFASAKNPGGGFLNGSQAQEETLARSSSLYLCQMANNGMYERQAKSPSSLYLDLALYSPSVPVFRDDAGAWLEHPVFPSIITCPAPNVNGLRTEAQLAQLIPTLQRRAELVLSVAAQHNESNLILGAWGCGVFGNDPNTVAHIFKDLLNASYRNVFKEVVFAVIGDSYSIFDKVIRRGG